MNNNILNTYSMKKSMRWFSDKLSLVKIFPGLFILGVALILQLNSCSHQKGKKDDALKIFMHWDMEGTSGLFTQQHAWYWEEGIPEEIAKEGCELLTADVNSAARAALDAGVDELIICDTHRGGNNIIPEKLISDPRITFLPRSVGMENGKKRWMPGMDESVDGLMLMGHHAKAGTEGAFLPHTQTTAWADFTINGQSVGEMGSEACYAGYWNVPVVLAHGDEACCREAEQQFPGVITAAVKRAESFDKATGPDPETARKLVARKVKEAVKKLKKGGDFTVYKPELPMTVTVRYASAENALKMSRKPGIKMTDSLTLEGVVDQQCDVLKWLTGTGLDMPE